MSNATQLKEKLNAILSHIDEGRASPDRSLRACVKGLTLLCDDITRIEDQLRGVTSREARRFSDEVVERVFGR